MVAAVVVVGVTVGNGYSVGVEVGGTGVGEGSGDATARTAFGVAAGMAVAGGLIGGAAVAWATAFAGPRACGADGWQADSSRIARVTRSGLFTVAHLPGARRQTPSLCHFPSTDVFLAAYLGRSDVLF